MKKSIIAPILFFAGSFSFIGHAEIQEIRETEKR